MKLDINGKEYDFCVKGTVGLVYLAEHVLGSEFRIGDNYHLAVLYYCCLQMSNKNRQIPTLDDFILWLRADTVAQMSKYFWTEWKRLEGSGQSEEEAQGEG